MEGNQGYSWSRKNRVGEDLVGTQNYWFLGQEFILQVWSPTFTIYIDCSVLSFLHTLVSAIIGFFRSITLADVIAGFKMVLRLIFVELPQMLWKGLKALGRGIHATLAGFFGCMYWIVYYIIFALIYVACFVPRRIGKIIAYIAGGIAQALKELWVWVSPKSMM
jgi:hypothetical protein